ncbi:MAG: hypothetical protein AB1634_05265 [Thermodesulfobacteriota bacterium]
MRAPDLPPRALHETLLPQLEWVLARFDQLVVTRSSGDLPGYRLRPGHGRPWYMLQIAGESSFFRDAEIPPPHRRAILQRLVDFQEDRRINLHVMVETRPEHLVFAAESGELARLSPLFRVLDVVVNMGFEARDPFLRNVLFAKDLDEDMFVRAVGVAKHYRLDPGVFLFTGGHVLTTGEMLAATRESARYLGGLGVFVNFMVPNLHTYTLPHLLWEEGVYALPEPFFLLDLGELAASLAPGRPDFVTPFHWFIGGLVADPKPEVTLLTNPRRLTSDAVTQEIAECLAQFAATHDARRFRSHAQDLRSHPEYRFYHAERQRQEQKPWDDRLHEALLLASHRLKRYDQRRRAALTTMLATEDS